jgi:hypothetical protein
MAIETTGSGPVRRLKFNPKTGQILHDKHGRPIVAEILPQPEMEACSTCFQLKIPRGTMVARMSFGQRMQCDECRLRGKMPNRKKALTGEVTA